MSFEKPDDVRKAQMDGDKEALSRMGKKGAKVSVESRAFNKDMKETAEQEQLLEAKYQELLHEHGEEHADQVMRELKDQE